MKKLLALLFILNLFTSCQPKTTVYMTNPEGGVDTLTLPQKQVIGGVPENHKGQ